MQVKERVIRTTGKYWGYADDPKFSRTASGASKVKRT
jgi:hypothetical protein